MLTRRTALLSLLSVPVIGLAAAWIWLLPALAQTHPNDNVYRYRVKDYVLQSPWNSFPDEVEKRRWDCFDDATKRTIDCGRAREPLERYRHIFRLRFLDHEQMSPGSLY